MDDLGRRKVLTAGLATALATGLTACTTSPQETTPREAGFDPHNWDDVRALFLLDRKLIHTAAFVLAAHPKPVREAIERHRRGLDVETNGYLHAHDYTDDEKVRSAAADDPALSAGIVCCDIDGMDPATARVMLQESGVVASVTPYQTPYLRFGPSIVTTPAQMDRVVDAVRRLRP